jgi:hypothetical protein
MVVLYALLFEELDIRLSKTYHYGDGYTLMLGHVPLVLALAWAVTLYTSMHILDCGPLSAPARVYGDALLALLIDLSIDAIGGHPHTPTPKTPGERAPGVQGAGERPYMRRESQCSSQGAAL